MAQSDVPKNQKISNKNRLKRKRQNMILFKNCEQQKIFVYAHNPYMLRT